MEFRAIFDQTATAIYDKDDSDYLAFKETTWLYSKFVYRSTFLCEPVLLHSQPIQICCTTMTNMQTELRYVHLYQCQLLAVQQSKLSVLSISKDVLGLFHIEAKVFQIWHFLNPNSPAMLSRDIFWIFFFYQIHNAQ